MKDLTSYRRTEFITYCRERAQAWFDKASDPKQSNVLVVMDRAIAYHTLARYETSLYNPYKLDGTNGLRAGDLVVFKDGSYPHVEVTIIDFVEDESISNNELQCFAVCRLKKPTSLLPEYNPSVFLVSELKKAE